MSIDDPKSRTPRLGFAPMLATFVLLACSRTGVGSAGVGVSEDGGTTNDTGPVTCPPTNTPVELARTAKFPGIRIAVSPTHVYWWDADHQVHRVPKCGGAAELVTTGQYYVGGLTFRWGTLFVADAVSIPKSSGRILAVDGALTRVALDHIDDGPSDLTSDDRGVYYLSGQQQYKSLLRLDWPSQTTTVLATSVSRFVVGGPYLYTFQPPGVFAIPLAGGAPIPLDARGGEPLTADDQGLYYYSADKEFDPTRSIRHVAVGSSFQVVVPDVDLSVAFGALDATRLYVPEIKAIGTPPETSDKGVVLAISRSTTEARELAATREGEFIAAIADDDTSIYWIEYRDGRVMKLDK